jgi:cytochrome c5
MFEFSTVGVDLAVADRLPQVARQRSAAISAALSRQSAVDGSAATRRICGICHLNEALAAAATEQGFMAPATGVRLSW